MSAEHTPGPWVAEKLKLSGYFEVATNHPKTALQMIVAHKVSDEADARLIVAAPEMLEVLQEVDEKNTEALATMAAEGVAPPAWFVEQCEKIKAVIAKATGGAA